ncbi:MAG: serine/threonine-protein kinase [Bryobacter sp.]|nr:serine/threonine-protein kinase [Bryobacter sp.]
MALSAATEAELFGQLIDLEESERMPALRAAGLDAEAEAQLARLLALDAGAADALDLEIREVLQSWAETSELEAGARLGRFQLLRKLGRGGMGEVWLVEFEEAGVSRRAAVKVLRAQLTHLEQRNAWERERRLAARLSHPYIAGMIESGTLDDGTLDGGQPYLLMEYVDGQRMDEALAGKSLRERVEVLRKVCEAVAAAHRQFVVHRDLKPGNVLITSDGLPKLVDFGIGHPLDLTETTLAAGTAAFASPEQLAGEEPAMASDVYSLGRMLERLAGDAGEDLSAIARKATSTAPQDRYATVPDLEAELRRWLAGRPVHAFGQGVGYRLRCFVRRHRWSTAGAAVAFAIIIAALLVAWQQFIQAQARTHELRALAGVAIFDLDEEVRKLPGSLQARRMLLETATGYLANLEAAARLDASARAELAAAYQKTAQLLYAVTGQSMERETESFALTEKSFRLREELGQFEAKDPKTRKGYAETARDYGQKLRLRRRIAESDTVMERAEQHAVQWLREEPNNWEAREQAQLLGNIRTRRLRLKGLQLALDNQRKLVAQLPDFRAAGAPPRNYWRIAALQNQLLSAVLVDDSLRPLAPELLTAATAAVTAAEEWNRVEPGVASTRLLLTIYLEGVEHTVEHGIGQMAEIDRWLRRSDEILSGPDLPDRDAAYWERNRLELLKVKGWAASGRGDLAEMARCFAECRQRLDRFQPQEQMWIGILRAQMNIKERQVGNARK